MLIGMCITTAVLLGASNIPVAAADGTITLSEAKKQLSALRAQVDALGSQIQQSEDSMNEALVQQALLQIDIDKQQALIDQLAPEFAAVFNAERQAQKWQYTLQFMLDDDSGQFINHMGITASVWAIWNEQMARLGSEMEQLTSLNDSLAQTIAGVAAEVQQQKALLKQQKAAKAEMQTIVNTLTAAQQQALGSPSQTIKPQTMHLIEVVTELFPKIHTIYTLRSGSTGDHGNGLAADFMLPDYKHNVDYGWQLANYVHDHARELGVQYVIYQQSIWNISRTSEGWRPMASRGNDTANHRDHIHVSMKG